MNVSQHPPVDAGTLRADLQRLQHYPLATQTQVRRIAARFVHETIGEPPPLQHALPVLALAHTLAALALVYGDPALIELAAEEAHRVLGSGRLTVYDIFNGGQP